MNENISHNFFIWEEKNSIEPKKNYENKNASETKDTTNDTQMNVENLHWKDITDPKLRLKAYKKDWYKNNKDLIFKKGQSYRLKNKSKLKLKKEEYYKNNKSILNDKKKTYYKLNKDKIKIKQKVWRNLNKDKKKTLDKAYRENNKDKRNSRHKAWHESNKDKVNIYYKHRRKTDIQFKLQATLRSRLHSAVKDNRKKGSAVKDLGCTIEQLKQYLESKFQPGMSWDNHTVDGWHIDHIKPLSSFDLSDRKQLLEACHYTNLQPLWAKDNLTKSDKII
jgi:hypothetical protein